MRALLVLAATIVVVPVPAAAAEEPEDKVVCKRVIDTDTGSNFRRSNKKCLKESEWKAIEEQKERTLRKIRDGGQMDPNRDQTFSGSPS